MIGGYRTEGAPTSWDLLNLGAPEQTEWMRDGLCAQTDPEAFYPAKGENATDAKAVCAGCPVRAACLAYALERGERFGVWGGKTDRERRKLRHVGTTTDTAFLINPGPVDDICQDNAHRVGAPNTHESGEISMVGTRTPRCQEVAL